MEKFGQQVEEHFGFQKPTAAALFANQGWIAELVFKTTSNKDLCIITNLTLVKRSRPPATLLYMRYPRKPFLALP